MLDHVPASPAGEFNVPAEAPQVIRYTPVFSGAAGEYFGIWFVNLLLGIVTLGIYSAWAKVRTERYFYANTRLAGSSFEYLADPLAILKGRLVAYAVVIALGLSARFSIGLYFALFLVLFVLMPWIVVLGLRFNARNSAWRGLTFGFVQSGGDAYGPFMGWPLLQAVTLSLVYPVMKKRQHAFVVDGHWFGRKRFVFDGDTGHYYIPYIIAAGSFMALFIGMAIGLGAMATAAGPGAKAEPALGGAMLAVMGSFYLGFFAVMVFLKVRYTNLMWNSTRLDRHRFESTLRVRDMMWLYASNLVAIVCTIGLAAPWAMIRLARYRAAHFAVVATGSIDDFTAEAEGQYGATGAEMVDALDLGLDMGF